MNHSTARGYNPHFERGYQALQAIINQHKDSLEFVQLDAGELVDDNGDAYQAYPRIRISFK